MVRFSPFLFPFSPFSLFFALFRSFRPFRPFRPFHLFRPFPFPLSPFYWPKIEILIVTFRQQIATGLWWFKVLSTDTWGPSYLFHLSRFLPPSPFILQWIPLISMNIWHCCRPNQLWRSQNSICRYFRHQSSRFL
jgi:hypothetical protein